MEQLTEELVTMAEITEYLPQQAPMIMVDRVFLCEGKGITTGLTVRPDNIFVHNGVLTEPGIIENMAQSANVKREYEIKKLDAAPAIGFLGCVTNLKIYFTPPVGSELVTELKAIKEVMQITLVKAMTHCRGELVAECEMKVLLRKE
ncbi:MAG: hydroxymyristoyl-ACP dehydratase [Bacteroidia bacterium]